MITFRPPYEIFDGVTLLPDHSNDDLRYVIPSRPQLGLTTNGRPDFSLIQYLGGGVEDDKIAGGLLTFSAELISPIAALIDQVDFELYPVMFDSGQVELIVLGVSSLSDVESGSPLDVKVLGSGKPTLAINNRVTFQLMLDANAAELVEKLIDTPNLPLILVYHMQLSGLRPSYQITIDADWHKVYTSLENKLDVNAYYVAADIELEIKRALEENNLDIDTIVFDSDSSGRNSAEAARRQVLDWVLERMFEPLFSTAPSAVETISETVTNVASSLIRAVVPGVSYKMRSLTQEQTRTFSIRMNETVAERREIVPQGTLGGLFRCFQFDDQGRPDPSWPAIRDSLVQKVNFQGLPRIQVIVAVEDRFLSDGVRQVEIELKRPDDSATQSFVFRQANERHTYIVNLLGAENPFDLPYLYRGIVHFDADHHFGSHENITTPWTEGRASDLFVEPRLAYSVEEIQIVPPVTFQFDQFVNIVVDLTYGDQTERLIFADSRPQMWRFRHFAVERPSYRYTVSYLRPEGADAADIVLPVKESTVDLLSLPHPAPDKRPLQILVNLPFDDIHVAFLELSYRDEEHGIAFEEQIDLSRDQLFLSRLYDIADGGSQEIRYRLTMFVGTDLLEGEWRSTVDSRLVVELGLLENRVVTVRPIGGTLEDNRLRSVKVLLQQRRSDGTVRAEKQIDWRGEAGILKEEWEFALGDPPIKEVYVQVTFVDSQGFANRLPWQKTEASNVIVHLQQQGIIV